MGGERSKEERGGKGEGKERRNRGERRKEGKRVGGSGGSKDRPGTVLHLRVR